MTSIRGLKPHEWPAADQQAWTEACRPAGRLTRGGNAAHLKPVTKVDLVRRYGQFLAFLASTGRLETDRSSSELITSENVSLFTASLNARVSSVSVHGAVSKLRRMGELLDSHWDSTWLRDVEQELSWEMRPSPKFHRIVDSDRLFAAGLRLMQRAEDGSHLPPCRRAVLYRNGLMVALLALCPIRLKSVADLKIGTSLKKVEDRWVIALSGADTKTGRPDERLVPASLCPAIDRYMAAHRRPRNEKETMLWIGRTGEPLGYSGVERSITHAAKAEVGVAVSPHLFRDCAASTVYRHAGDSPTLAAALLQHTDPRVTERHYNRARSASFAVEFGRMIEHE